MFEPKTLAPKSDRQFLPAPPPRRSTEHRQQRLMAGALVLLLVALGLLLYKDRDFWFPSTQEAEEPSEESLPAATTAPVQPAATASTAPVTGKKERGSKPQAMAAAPVAPSTPPATTAAPRTVLPPLEVEVVAGDIHRTVRPGSNSVRVDLQPGSPPQTVSEGAPTGPAGTSAGVTSNAAERVQISADTAQVVNNPVKPNYPLLARQMKVQGSVILQALIGRDGVIQDLHVLSGPPILASAAQEAVRQWRFKPHYLGSEAVETQAKITVNFTISTN